MLKKYLFIALLLTSTLASIAQYNVTYDKPILNGHYLNIGIIDLDLKSLASWNLRYDTYLGNGKVNLSMEYANISNLKALRNFGEKYFPEFVSSLDSVDNEIVTSEKLIPKKFEVGGTFNFHQRMVRKNKMIHLYSYGTSSWGGSTTVYVYTMKYISVYRFTGARAGIGIMRSLYFGESNTSSLTSNNVKVTPTPPIGEDFLFTTRFNQTYGYIGISRNSIYNVKISGLAGQGVRNDFTAYYLDLLFLMGSNIDEVANLQTNQYYSVETIDKSKLNRIGWRFGARSQAVRYFGIGTIFEVGKFTGGTLVPGEITDALSDEIGILKYVNYMRIGISFSLTGPIMDQYVQNKW